MTRAPCRKVMAAMLACCLKCRFGYLKVFDARHMVEDVFAELVPAIDSESEMSASRHCA